MTINNAEIGKLKPLPDNARKSESEKSAFDKTFKGHPSNAMVETELITRSCSYEYTRAEVAGVGNSLVHTVLAIDCPALTYKPLTKSFHGVLGSWVWKTANAVSTTSMMRSVRGSPMKRKPGRLLQCSTAVASAAPSTFSLARQRARCSLEEFRARA